MSGSGRMNCWGGAAGDCSGVVSGLKGARRGMRPVDEGSDGRVVRRQGAFDGKGSGFASREPGPHVRCLCASVVLTEGPEVQPDHALIVQQFPAGAAVSIPALIEDVGAVADL